MKDNTAAYQAFYDSWTSEHGAPPSVLDWSSCRNERSKFGTWARRRLLPLSPGRNFVGSKFRKFYHEWLATHGNPPSAKDYEGNAKERAALKSPRRDENLNEKLDVQSNHPSASSGNPERYDAPLKISDMAAARESVETPPHCFNMLVSITQTHTSKTATNA